MHLTRRAALVGGLSAGLLARRGLSAPSPEKRAVVIIFFTGGFSSIFSAADSYLSGKRTGWFSVTPSNVFEVGGGIFVDKDTIGTLPPAMLAQMGVAGMNFGWSDHENGPRKPFVGLHPSTSNPVYLAQLLGGNAPLRYAHVGERLAISHPEYQGVFCTPVLDLAKTRALLLRETVPGLPSATGESLAVVAAKRMSRRHLEKNPAALADYSSAADGLVGVLASTPPVLDWAEIASAYGIAPESATLKGMAEKFAAAELMIRAGANVVTLSVDRATIEGGGWDSHGDPLHAKVRSEMTRLVMPTLPIFLTRMLGLSGYNVVVSMAGEFARTYAPNQDGHGSTLSALVFGKKVKNATTGVEPITGLPKGDDAVRGYWALLAEAVGLEGKPFGTHSHQSLLRL
jgi:hypothetical protein